MRIFGIGDINLLVGFVSLITFSLWYGISSSSQAAYLTKEAQSRSEAIQGLREDPTFSIFTPTYLPSWAGQITEEKVSKDVEIFGWILDKGTVYYRDYSNGRLQINQYKPNVKLSEEGFLQKDIELLEKYSHSSIQTEELNIKGFRALYILENDFRPTLNHYRNGQRIQIKIDPNSVIVALSKDPSEVSQTELKQELIKVAESLIGSKM